MSENSKCHRLIIYIMMDVFALVETKTVFLMSISALDAKKGLAAGVVVQWV